MLPLGFSVMLVFPATPLRRPSLRLYARRDALLSIHKKRRDMEIQQTGTIPLNSPAGPLPTGATGARFPLTAGLARYSQEVDLNQIFNTGPAILECVNEFFRCLQRQSGR